MPPIITIENLSKSYASGLRALHNVNLEIREGEIFALLGPNGAGKTTLIGTVCGLVQPTEGRITLRNLKLKYRFETPYVLHGVS